MPGAPQFGKETRRFKVYVQLPRWYDISLLWNDGMLLNKTDAIKARQDNILNMKVQYFLVY